MIIMICEEVVDSLLVLVRVKWCDLAFSDSVLIGVYWCLSTLTPRIMIVIMCEIVDNQFLCFL